MNNQSTNQGAGAVDHRPAKYLLESGDVVTGVVGNDGTLYESVPGDTFTYPAGSFKQLNVQIPVEARLPEFPYRVRKGDGY